MTLQGGSALRARLKAIRLTFKVYGRPWADETAAQAKRGVQRVGAVDTGRLLASIRRKSVTQRKATVVGHYTSNFVDAGSKAHDIRARRGANLIFKNREGQTIFARKVHKQRIAARRFKRPAADAALRKYPLSETMTKLWNEAAA